MGEIKIQLAGEAERDRLKDRTGAPTKSPAPDRRSSLTDRFLTEFLIGSAQAQSTPVSRSDEMSVTVKPGDGIEIKLNMKKGEKVNFNSTSAGGPVNFDMHGEGGGQSTSYEKGRNVPSAQGVLDAAFDGSHGWFWRNRGKSPVVITLKATGSYSEIKQM